MKGEKVFVCQRCEERVHWKDQKFVERWELVQQNVTNRAFARTIGYFCKDCMLVRKQEIKDQFPTEEELSEKRWKDREQGSLNL